MTSKAGSVFVEQAEFFFGTKGTDKLPKDFTMEIAFAGRSNAGKSSLINRFIGKRDLARASSKPGSTRQFNFFRISAKKGARKLAFVLADLPGFGFAKLSKADREELEHGIVNYIRTREQLKLVFLLQDCRRSPERSELAIRDIVLEEGKHLLIVVTKTDKLKRTELAKRLSEIADAYSLEAADLLISGEKVDVDPLWNRMFGLLK